MKTEHEKEMFGVKIDNELQTAAAGLTFKTGLPESVTKVILAQANEKVKGMNPEYIDDGKCGKILAFKDASGAIMRNPNNQLNPFTPGELLTKELETMGVLEPKRQQPGGGTEPPKRQPGGGSITVDASGAKTRTEAYDVIANSLMQQGLTIGSKAFDDAMKQAWQDNNISQLPEK